MVPVPVADEDLDLIIAYACDAGEERSNAIVNAFLASDIDVYGKDTQLENWIDTDALAGLDWSAASSTSLFTHIWGHPVVLTPEEVRVYAPTSPQ